MSTEIENVDGWISQAYQTVVTQGDPEAVIAFRAAWDAGYWDYMTKAVSGWGRADYDTEGYWYSVQAAQWVFAGLVCDYKCGNDVEQGPDGQVLQVAPSGRIRADTLEDAGEGDVHPHASVTILGGDGTTDVPTGGPYRQGCHGHS